jgi:integrase
MKYKASRDLPDFSREHKTLSPTKLAQLVLNRRNEKIKPQAITMWFKRHPEIHEQLRKENIEKLPTEKEQIDASIFQNGQFQEIPSVKNWLLEMNARELSRDTISSKIITLRQLCQGRFPMLKIDLVAEGKMSLKHPDRLSLQDALEIIMTLKMKDVDATYFKHVLKDFLLSKEVVVGKKIVVGRSKNYGKLAKLFVERSILNQMLSWIKSVNFEAYVVDDFMFKTGTRITATLKALIENMNFQQHTMRVYDKARHSLYPEGKEWEKYISLKLWQNLRKLIGKRKSGKIFNVSDDTLSKINREALKRFVPELEPKIQMPNHFWRHMFFQHMLRITNWNYAVCAELGGSTVASLQESYGKPPQEIVRQWGLKFMPTLEASEEMMPIQTIKRR